MSKNSITDNFDEFIKNIDDHNAADKLLLTAGLVELLRHAKSPSTPAAMAELLVSISGVPFDQIPFSMTKTLMSADYRKAVMAVGVPGPLVAEVLLTALIVFLDSIATEPPTEELLRGIVESLAESTGAAAHEKKVELPGPPDVFAPRLVKRVFDPVEFNEDVVKKLQANVVVFRALTATGVPGPEIRGLAFENGTDQYFVLLETGEYLTVPKDYEHITITHDASDYRNLFPTLLLAVAAIAEELETYGVITPEQHEFIKAGGLGNLKHGHFRGVTDVADIAPLEHVFDIGREAARMGVTGATGPVGATVRFPVPDTEMVVVLEASQDALGPYSTARLVRQNSDGNEVVVMRHETPRLYSLRGVYLFPLPDRLISLTAIF